MKIKPYKRALRFCGLILIIFLTACDTQNQEDKNYPFLLFDNAMGTRYQIRASQLPSPLSDSELKDELHLLLDKLSNKLSTYQQNSELSDFNRSNSTNWQDISEDLYVVLKEAEKVSRMSGGAFDVTVGSLNNLWRFGPDPSTLIATSPSDESIKETLAKIGYRQLLLKDKPFAAKKSQPNLHLDLSGLSKGYVVDKVAELLESKGIFDYMIDVGGVIRLKGKNISDEAWRIAIEKPTVEHQGIEQVLPISDTGMVTIGDHHKYYEVDGRRFSHIIDPRVGYPITHKLASVTVLDSNTLQASAFATALMVMGPVEGMRFAEQNHIPTLFIIKTEDGFIEKASKNFPLLNEKEEEQE